MVSVSIKRINVVDHYFCANYRQSHAILNTSNIVYLYLSYCQPFPCAEANNDY